jgi:hypothetical protein
MKNLSFLFSVICVFFFLFLAGCNPKTKIINNNVKFDSIQVAESYYLFNDSSQPSCNIEIFFVYPDSSDEQLLKTLQDIFLEKMFGDSFRGFDPKQAAKVYAEQYIQEFKRFETLVPDDSIYAEEEKYEDETGFSYYVKMKTKVLFNQNNFISFFVEFLSYEGGAHSSRCKYAYVINLETGELLQEEQFTGYSYYSDISCILIDKIAEANSVTNTKDLEYLGYNSLDDICPNNNFTIDNKGITYYFNENEIAGTMMGLTQVFIPYEELKIYIKKDSPLFPIAND